jgi:hypothetical protein
MCQHNSLFVLFVFQAFGAKASWGHRGQVDLQIEANGQLHHQVMCTRSKTNVVVHVV